MSRLRQLMRPTRENGGSAATFCLAKRHISRMALLTRYWLSCRLVLEEFQKRHHQRIRFLAGRASRHPDADRRVRWLVLQNLREDAVLERLESLGLAEEARDVDQNVLI